MIPDTKSCTLAQRTRVQCILNQLSSPKTKWTYLSWIKFLFRLTTKKKILFFGSSDFLKFFWKFRKWRIGAVDGTTRSDYSEVRKWPDFQYKFYQIWPQKSLNLVTNIKGSSHPELTKKVAKKVGLRVTSFYIQILLDSVLFSSRICTKYGHLGRRESGRLCFDQVRQ